MRHKNCCIYAIVSPSDNVYIGQTYDFNKRICKHKINSRTFISPLYSSVRKHGWDLHKVVFLHIFEYVPTQSEIDDLEKFYFIFFADYHRLMNIREAGSRGLNSPETIQRMKEAKKNHVWKKHTQESIEKIRKSKMGNQIWLGKKHTEASKQKIREYRLNHKK